MSIITAILIVFTFILFCIVYIAKLKLNVSKRCTVPNGPTGLPLFGHIFQLGKRPYETLTKWGKTIGPIYKIRLGSQEVVVLNGTDLIREALIKNSEEFAGRPYLYMTHATLKGKGIISSPYNTDYDEHKRFLLDSFNKFGRRRSSLEISCLESIRETLNEYRENADHIFLSSSAQIKTKMNLIASQNVLTMAFGSRVHDKNTLNKLIDLITANFENASVAAAYNFLPITRIFKSSIMKNVMKCSEFLNSLVSERLENFDPNGVHNIIDAYLTELTNNIYLSSQTSVVQFKNNINLQNTYETMKTEGQPIRRSRYKSFSFDHLNSIVQDLFVAGTETVANTLNWAIVYVTYFPQYQKLIHEEIDRVIGREKLPAEEDRGKLNYTEAFINETMRYHCAGPILIPRSTTKDTELCGYTIPANTFVMVNMWSCMRDEKYFQDANNFNPARFLDENGNLDIHNPAMMPFSAGERACMGELLARSQLFLIFTSLLQKFRFSFTFEKDANDKTLLNGIAGITLSPPNVPLKLQIR